MLTEDYLIRMINLAIAALLEIVGLKEKGDYLTALARIDMTFEHLLGLRTNMVKGLDDDRLYYLLTRNDRLDTRRLLIVADLFHQEGDVYTGLGKPEEAREDYARALRFDLELIFNAPEADGVELTGRIEDLIQKLDIAGAGMRALGADTLWPLAGYFEESGAFARAESVLLELANRPDTRAGIQPELAAFYERLSGKKREDLERGGLSMEQVQAGLARWRGM